MENRLTDILAEKYPQLSKNKLLNGLIIPQIYQVGGKSNSHKNNKNNTFRKCITNDNCVDDKMMNKLFNL